MTPFHLTKTVRFVQNDDVFYPNSKKREELDDMSSGYCSSSFIFLPKKVVRVTTFQGHLMLLPFTKLNKTYTIMMTRHLTISRYGLFQLIDTTATVTLAQEGNSGSL